jgi:hypothetical protein
MPRYLAIMKHCIALLFIIASVLPAHALTTSGDALVTCRQFNEDAGGSRRVYSAWINGFLSGRNLYSVQGKMPEFNDTRVAQELAEFCSQVPDAWLINAAIAIAAKLNHEQKPEGIIGAKEIWRGR